MIPETIKKINMSPVAQQYNLSLVVLFGSQARGTAVGSSDIDIAILSHGEFSLHDEMAVEESFKKIIGTDSVQVINMRSAPPLLLREIMRDGAVLYQENSTVYETMKSYAYKMFIETKWLRDLRHRRLAELL